MSEIEVVYECPVVFTKDRDWAQTMEKIKPGAIVVLPDDAVLFVPPTDYSVPDDAYFPTLLEEVKEGEAS